MYNQFNPQIERLKKQKEEIDNILNTYQNVPQQPINNFINQQQQQTPNLNMVEWRILNENEQVDNLYVNNKTLFINDKNMVLKGVDGSLEKWEVKKVYPIDKKDERINQLENEIKQLKEMMANEYAEHDKPINGEFKSNVNDDGNVKSKSRTSVK